MTGEEYFRDSYEPRRGTEESQSVLDHKVLGRRPLRLLEVVDRRAEQQCDRIVLACRAVDDDLNRHHRILGMQQDGLLGREMPRIAKPAIAVARAELPERGVPRRAVAWGDVRTARDQPALDDLSQEALCNQSLSVET